MALGLGDVLGPGKWPGNGLGGHGPARMTARVLALAAQGYREMIAQGLALPVRSLGYGCPGTGRCESCPGFGCHGHGIWLPKVTGMKKLCSVNGEVVALRIRG